MDRRDAAVREVAAGVTGERVGTATSVGEMRGLSAPVGVGQFLVRQKACPGVFASSSVDIHGAEVGSRDFGSLM